MVMQSKPLTLEQVAEMPTFSPAHVYKLHQWRIPKHGDTCHLIVAPVGKSSKRVVLGCNAKEPYGNLKGGRAKYRCPVCREYAVKNNIPIY